MNFEWDEMKRQINLSKHGIDFADVIHIFEGYTLTVEDTRYGYDEPRFWTIGLLGATPILVVHTYVDEKTIRLISARRATKHEQNRFFA
jgi:uncharacterized protein